MERPKNINEICDLYSKSIGRLYFDLSPQETPLQILCETYRAYEQSWLDTDVAQNVPRLGAVAYGFFEDPVGEMQAHAFVHRDYSGSYIAVSPFILHILGSTFQSSLASSHVLLGFGNTSNECHEDIPSPKPMALRPNDPERRRFITMLSMMAMRFLTAHELGHIVNGHLEYLKSRMGFIEASMSERRRSLSKQEALFHQTLEMDADAFAVQFSLPPLLDLELNPDNKILADRHPIFREPLKVLKLWLYSTYVIFDFLYGEPRTISDELASHPNPRVRLRMLHGTLDAVLEKFRFDRLRKMAPKMIEQVISEHSEWKSQLLQQEQHPLISRQTYWQDVFRQEKIRCNWVNVRPLLEPFHRGAGRLAPLPKTNFIPTTSPQRALPPLRCWGWKAPQPRSR